MANLTDNAVHRLNCRDRSFFRGLKDALPIQEPDRVVIVVDVPDWPEVGEIQNGVLGKAGHVVDDTVRLVAVVPGDGGNAAIFDTASDLHFAGNHIVFTGSEMFVPGNAGPLRAIEQNGPVARLLGRPKEFEANSRIELNPWLLRGMDVDVFEPLVVQRVSLRLVTGHLLPPWLVKGKAIGERPFKQGEPVR